MLLFKRVQRLLFCFTYLTLSRYQVRHWRHRIHYFRRFCDLSLFIERRFEFISILSRIYLDVDEGTEIVSFDVISFYTSISHEFGLEAIDYFLTKYQEDLHPRFRKEFVLESANFILKNNTSTFDSEFYLQIKGTAMGTIFAPTIANLTMGYHEIKVYSLSVSAAL